jgi:hypothetical protein
LEKKRAASGAGNQRKMNEAVVSSVIDGRIEAGMKLGDFSMIKQLCNKL